MLGNAIAMTPNGHGLVLSAETFNVILKQLNATEFSEKLLSNISEAFFSTESPHQSGANDSIIIFLKNRLGKCAK